MRSDTIHKAPCKLESLRYCRMYCQRWENCEHLTPRSKARRRKVKAECDRVIREVFGQ